MIDTHTHIYNEAFDTDFQEAMKRAADRNVEQFIFPGIDSSTHSRMMDRAAQCNGRAFTAIGLHPTSVAENWKSELDFVESRLSGGPWVAIGEIGLDRHWSDTFFEEQKEVFRIQLQWAAESQLPVIIHVREAHDTLFEILDNLILEKGLHIKGVMHAFSSSVETYRRIRRYGSFRIGIGGVVTYKNAGLAQTVKEIPLSDIVLETDSPWLTPVPHRGTRNEPAYLPLIAARIAELQNISIEEVHKTTTTNAKELFQLN